MIHDITKIDQLVHRQDCNPCRDGAGAEDTGTDGRTSSEKQRRMEFPDNVIANLTGKTEEEIKETALATTASRLHTRW